MSIGLLLLRVALGAALLAQGAAKLRPKGRRPTADSFEQLGFRPALPFALLAGVTELGAGLLLMAGLGTVLAGAGAVAVLGLAVAVTWRNGYWNAGGGVEYPLVAGLAATALMFTGPGRHSFDQLFGWATPSTATTATGIAVAIVAAGPVLALRGRRLRTPANPLGVDAGQLVR